MLRSVQKRRTAGLPVRVVRGGARSQDADPPQLVVLLGARRQRPCCRSAKQRNELAPLHSITSSARASSVGGTSRPRALAATILMTSSYLVGISTGKSPGFVPLRMDAT